MTDNKYQIMRTEPPQDKLSDSRRRAWGVAWIIILVVSAIPYVSSLKGLPVWDDYGILNGGFIGGGKELLSVLTEPFNIAYFRPMVSLSFFVDHKMFGPSPFFFHQTNIILHLACTAACGWLAGLLFRDRLTAATAALLFGIQPIQAGATAWIGGRTDVLCCLFVVLYSCFLVKLARDSKAIKWSILAAVSLLCAGLCKEQAMASILAAPLALALLSSEERPNRRDVIRAAIPLVVSCLAFLALWTTFGIRAYIAQPHTLLQQLELGGRGITHNFLMLAAPTPAGLHTFSFEPSRTLGVLPVIAGWLVLTGAVWACIRFRKSHPQVVWLAVTAGLLVLPVSSVIPLPSLHLAPYRLVIAGPAVACLTAGLLMAARPAAKWPLLLLLVGWHGSLTAWAAPRWMSEKKIFSTIVRYDPGFITARVNYSGSDGVTPEEGAASTRELLDWIFGSSEWTDLEWAENEYRDNPEVERRLQDNVGNKSDPKLVLSGVFDSLSVSLLDADDLEGAGGRCCECLDV